MKALSLEITNTCNEKCRHCYQPENSGKQFISDLELLNKMFAELSESGFIFLSLTGGEPLLHPEFKEICLLAQKNRYIISVKTNGVLINNDLAQFLKKLKPSSVEVSLYSADPEEHDFITCVKGSFNASVEGIMALKKHNVKVSVMTPVLNGIKKWKELLPVMKNMGVPWSCSPNIRSSFDERDEVEQFRGDSSYHLDFFEFINGHENQKKLNLENKCFKECGGGISTICVAPDYSVRACLSYPGSVGIYTGGNAKELLSKARKQLEERFAKLECHQCGLVKYCDPCPAHLKIVDGVGKCDPAKKEFVKAYLKFFGEKA